MCRSIFSHLCVHIFFVCVCMHAFPDMWFSSSNRTGGFFEERSRSSDTDFFGLMWVIVVRGSIVNNLVLEFSPPVCVYEGLYVCVCRFVHTDMYVMENATSFEG